MTNTKAGETTKVPATKINDVVYQLEVNLAIFSLFIWETNDA